MARLSSVCRPKLAPNCTEYTFRKSPGNQSTCEPNDAYLVRYARPFTVKWFRNLLVKVWRPKKFSCVNPAPGQSTHLIMTSTQTDHLNRLALVSSLYGPGTVTSWYLTIISLGVSWLWHPQKRTSDSIDVDLITVLTFPTVAAGHLLYQLRQLLVQDYDAQAEHKSDGKLVQMFAAAEAPLVLTNASLVITTFLIVVASLGRNLRRAFAVTLVLLLCLCIEIYFYVSVPRSPLIGATPRRYSSTIRLPRSLEDIMLGSPAVLFPRGFENILIITTAAVIQGLFILAILLLGARMQDWSSRKTSSRVFQALLIMSLCLAALMCACLFADRFSSTFEQIWIPASAYSIMDLDQAVATAAGATVLGCSLYSMAIARYRAQKALLT